MERCCQMPVNESSIMTNCPVCHLKRKRVPLITLKSLLKPTSLETINHEECYAFCPNPSCEVVYFSHSKMFRNVAAFMKTVKLKVLGKPYINNVPTIVLDVVPIPLTSKNVNRSNVMEI